jgi:hypothetical protein
MTTNLQATHCWESPSFTGRWRSPKGDRWWRVWACPDHLERLTGLRELGRRRGNHPEALCGASVVDADLRLTGAVA